MNQPADGTVLALPRGGVVVRTSAGPIQFGCPPETIKDSMALGLPVPGYYVVPRERFDRQRGVNLSEVEFPAYFSFFVQKRRITLISDEEGERSLRQVLTETLFGPRSYPPSDAEYDPSVPLAARRDHAREGGQFRRNPFDPESRMDVDTLVEFVRFDGEGAARLGEQVVVRRLEGGGHVVHDGEAELARVPERVQLPPREVVPEDAGGAFDPPDFGVTVLGSSHGFDPRGKTTGFILWINRRGLLVDPPVGSTDLLRSQGVAPKLIDGIILTHCHADHDSGTFQKILEEGRVALYTTPTILGSFLRKYSALSRLDETFLRRTFINRPARIGAPVRVHGGELRFFYTLHSIPTVGFEAYYGGKSLVFSGDTLYDPERIRAMADEGTISPERAGALINFPWHHHVILHEAGVPPLHTPTAVLARLPEDVKQRLYLVHIAGKDVPEGEGLRVAPVGVPDTLRIEVTRPRHADAIALLDVFAGIDLFRGFSLARARELLQVARLERHPAGARVIDRGSSGDAFYVIVSGVASVRRGSEELKRYHAGDYFGETALILGQPRNADVFAHSELELVRIAGSDFLCLLRGTDIPERLVRLAHMREQRTWELFARNAVLEPLTSGQKTQLQSYLTRVELAAGAVLWRAGATPEAAFLLDEGRALLEGYGPDGQTYGPGALLGEVDALVEGRSLVGSARVVEPGHAFRIARADLVRWFHENPGLHLAFLGANAVE